MSKVFNVAGGPIGKYTTGGDEPSSMRNIEVTLKAGYSNTYYLHDYFNPDSVTVKITYTDGSTNENASNYVWFPARPLETTDEYITFKAVEGGNVIQTRFRIIVRDYQLVEIPKQIGTLTYNGNLQFPTWDYDQTKVRMVDGTSSRSEAGTYSTTFTLIDPSTTRWNIDTSEDYFADQVVQWTIGKRQAQIRVQPPDSSQLYTNSYTFYIREQDTNQSFFINCEGITDMNLSDATDQDIIRIRQSENFNGNIQVGYDSKALTLLLTFNSTSFPYHQGDSCTITISVNNDKLNNYEYSGTFILTLLLYDRWQFGTYSDGSVADKEWFQGLAKSLSQRYYLEDWIGVQKHMSLDSEILGTIETSIICRDATASYVDFQLAPTLNQPLKPNYGSSSGTVTEYDSSTFQVINNQLAEAIPGKDYMGNIPQYIVLAGFPSSSRQVVSNRKVITPTACDMGLIQPDLDTPQENGEDISYSDYNGEVNNKWYIDDTRRQKTTSDSMNNVKYWTRSTYVKYLQSGQEKRHFVVVDENGQAMDVNAQTTDLDIYHAPIFRIVALT